MSAVFGEGELDMYDGQPGPKGDLYRAVKGKYWSAGARDRARSERRRNPSRSSYLGSFQSQRVPPTRDGPPEHKEMLADRNPSLPSPRPWTSSDGQQLLFNDPEKLERNAEDRSFEYEVVNFRPHAKYLYCTYIVVMLRNVYKIDKSKHTEPNYQKVLELGKQEEGEPYGGSRDRYIKIHYIQEFIEAMGHE